MNVDGVLASNCENSNNNVCYGTFTPYAGFMCVREYSIMYVLPPASQPVRGCLVPDVLSYLLPLWNEGSNSIAGSTQRCDNPNERSPISTTGTVDPTLVLGPGGTGHSASVCYCVLTC